VNSLNSIECLELLLNLSFILRKWYVDLFWTVRRILSIHALWVKRPYLDAHINVVYTGTTSQVIPLRTHNLNIMC